VPGAFAAIYLIWGSTFLAALIGLEGFPPFLLTGLRFSLAGLLLLGWCVWRGEPLPAVKSVARNSLSGVLMLAGGTGSVIWAEQHISSGMAAILVAVEPFLFIALDRKSWPDYFSAKAIPVGLGIGMTGFLLLFLWPGGLGSTTPGSLQVTGTVVVLLGGLSWVAGSLYARYRLPAQPAWINSGVQLLAAGAFCLLLSTALSEWQGFSFSSVSLRAWGALVYMAVMGSIVAYTAYLWLLSVRPPAVVGTHTYINPLVAVVLGWLFAREPVLASQIVSLVIILLGVLMVNWPRYRKAG
jgi:drug/metabolite transporter (DMT)-like permease